MFSLKNKTAVVTGGGSGIGKAIAELFAKQGAVVHIVDVQAGAVQMVCEELNERGLQCFAHVCDLTRQKDVLEVFRKISAVDILVNNAGIAHIGTVETTSEAELDELINVNIKGVYNCLYGAIPLMKNAGGGSILNMCSIAAQLGLEARFAYSMSKGAVYAMTLSVAKDYLKYNIRCNSISPARVRTPFVDGFIERNYAENKVEMFERLSKSQPIGRMGKPEEVATLALYLCSDEAAFITGCDYPLDGGVIKLST